MKIRRTETIRLLSALLLIFLFSLGLMACGGSPEAPKPEVPALTEAITEAPAEPSPEASVPETQPPAETAAPETQAPTEAAPAPAESGEPAPSGDGICKTREDFFRLYTWIENMDKTYQQKFASYDLVRDCAGVEAADGKHQDAVFEREIGRHTMSWYSPDKDYHLLVTFSGDHDNVWRLLQYSISGPDLQADTPKDPLLIYEYFDEPPSDFAGPQTAVLQGGDLSVSFTLPDHGWVLKTRDYRASLYFAMDPNKTSGRPVLEITCKPTKEDLELNLSSYENLTDTEGMDIGGVTLAGRTYDYKNMHWQEYYGALPNGLWISVSLGDLSLHPDGEAMAILRSISFS